jgi:hypothetical protein
LPQTWLVQCDQESIGRGDAAVPLLPSKETLLVNLANFQQQFLKDNPSKMEQLGWK